METLWSGRWLLLEGLWLTVQLFLAAIPVALAVAFVLGFARVYGTKWLSGVAEAVGQFFRGTSLVVQLFWIYFVLPMFGISISAFATGVTALGLCYGAYAAVTVRSALLAVPVGQREAATSLGIGRCSTLAHIELPQAILLMIPSFANHFVLMLKSTSVAALVTLNELTFQTNILTSNTGATIEVFAFVLVAYYVMSKCVIALMRRLGSHLGTYRFVER